MPLYYYLFLFILLTIFIFLIRSFILRRKNIPFLLYAEALKDENCGRFLAAALIYRKALGEVKKIRFHKNLETKIIEKLKVLHTVIEYEKKKPGNVWIMQSIYVTV